MSSCTQPPSGLLKEVEAEAEGSHGVEEVLRSLALQVQHCKFNSAIVMLYINIFQSYRQLNTYKCYIIKSYLAGIRRSVNDKIMLNKY